MGADPAAHGANVSNTAWLGIALYTNYLYPLRSGGRDCCWWRVVAAVALTLRQRKDSKA
jgi:NADH-quinone oxidoreductase subunit J